MKEARFTVMLTPEDRYRHHHVRLKRDVLSFIVQYETKLEDRWFPVVRYDTRHGFAHRDILDKKGKKQKTPIFAKDYNEALTFAEYDIKSNWRDCKQQFLRGFRDENRER
ncbi:MAG: hypothetical protein E3J87_10255 [Candidatus Cloacimonadota bacterium]|nr:MAG: hypothetical protein E3J87_10255 [Candidatus Cloacimonadota bacterium]